MVTDAMPSPDDPLTRDRPDLLRAYERYSTRSPEAAEAESARLLSPHQLSVGRDASRFWASA
jgi:hypothetical protein